MSVELIEQQNWAKIWKVAPQMEGTRPLDEGDQTIIDQIAQLRRLGQLTEAQQRVLDLIGQNRSIGVDPFE